jgi:uncharacterized iron-regulated protein
MSGIRPWLTASVLAVCLCAGARAAGASGNAAQPPTATACLAAATWHLLNEDGARAVSAGDVIADMARREVVLLGERHQQAEHHRWQLQTLAALHAARPDLVIGFEAFPRRVQPVLDRWVAGELRATEFLKEADWKTVWGYPPELYLPLFHFARMNRIPMIALNVERALTRAVAAKGWDAIPPEQREGLSQPLAPAAAYREYLLGVFRRHAQGAGAEANDRAFGYFVEAQATWDRAMAEALAQRLRGRARPPLVVGIAGAGHVRFGHGIAHQLRDLGVERVGILLPLEAQRACEKLGPGLADAVFVLPPFAGERASKP